MRALHVGLRVSDRERSLAFYRAVGYQVVGDVPETGLGHLTMLKLPEDDYVTLELVHKAGEPPASNGSLSHLVIQVDSMESALADLAERGVEAEAPTSPDGSADFLTSHVVDPDGNQIELVQWPAGHADGMTKSDFR